MCNGRMTFWAGLAAIWVAVLSGCPAAAAPVRIDVSGSYWGGLELKDQDVAINRFSINAALKKRWGSRLQLDLSTDLEWADDEAGLGGVNTFAALSKPIIDSDRLRFELARATLLYRSKDLSVTLGKQTLAWGVLDGLRVADRADPVRRRDFILTEQRPERIGRFGIRSRKQLGAAELDVAVMFDGSADQFATPGRAFFPSASRSLGGLDVASLGTLTEPMVDKRRHSFSQASYAAKLGVRLGAFDTQLIGLHGPDTEPLIAARSLTDVELRYPTRSLLAATAQRALGATVVRLEAAFIPDQAINLAQPGQTDRARRYLAGAGIDFKLAGDWFVNAQLGIDSLEPRSTGYARPRTDVVATVRAQRSYLQERLGLKTELIGSPKDQDGYLGASLSWQFDDRLKGTLGADWLFGGDDHLFGQFSDRSRAWIRLVYTP